MKTTTKTSQDMHETFDFYRSNTILILEVKNKTNNGKTAYKKNNNEHKPSMPNYHVPSFDLGSDAYYQVNHVHLDQYKQHFQSCPSHLHTCQITLCILQVEICSPCIAPTTIKCFKKLMIIWILFWDFGRKVHR